MQPQVGSPMAHLVGTLRPCPVSNAAAARNWGFTAPNTGLHGRENEAGLVCLCLSVTSLRRAWCRFYLQWLNPPSALGSCSHGSELWQPDVLLLFLQIFNGKHFSVNFFHYVYAVICNKAFWKSSFVHLNKYIFVCEMKNEHTCSGKRPSTYLYACVSLLTTSDLIVMWFWMRAACMLLD